MSGGAWRRRLYGSFIFVIFLTSSLAISDEISAQKSSAEVLEWYGQLLETQIPKIRDLIRPNMTAEEREIDARVRIRVIRDDVNNAAAFVGNSIIEIHVGLVRAMDMITSARAYAMATGDRTAPGEWLTYVAEEIDQWRSNPKQARDLGNIQSFATFVEMDKAEWESFRATPAVGQQFDIEMNSSLMWLVGHELGHHFLKHKRPSDLSKSREQEEQADEIARRLMRDTGYSPYFTSPVLIAFAVWEPEADLYESASTHPAPLTRIEHNLRNGAEQLLEDPDFRLYLRDTGQEASFQEQIAADLKALQTLRLPNWGAP